MPSQLFANNAASLLASSLTNVATSLAVTAGHGARFPTITGSDYFLATLCQMSGVDEANFEIVKVTARSTDTFTIVRAQEGTTALAYNAGDKVELRLTKGTMEGREAISNKDATGGYPGLTLFKLNMRNAANTITSWFTNAATVARTWTLPDKDGTVAMTDVWVIKTTTYTAVAGDAIMANTTSAAFTINLPASPAANDTVDFADYAGTFGTKNLTIGRNSSKIMGLSEDLTVNVNNAQIKLVYIDSTAGWRIV